LPYEGSGWTLSGYTGARIPLFRGNGDTVSAYHHLRFICRRQVLAWQMKANGSFQDHVLWEHRDAGGASFRMTDSAGGEQPHSGYGAEYSTSAEYDPAGADASLLPVISLPEPPEASDGGSLLGYPGAGVPAFLRSSFARDGIPMDVDSFMSHLNSHFASSFDVLGGVIRGSTRVIGTRTITERFTFRGHSAASGLDDMEAGIARFGSWDTFSFTRVTTLPIYDSSSWSFSEISSLFNHAPSQNFEKAVLTYKQKRDYDSQFRVARKMLLSGRCVDFLVGKAIPYGDVLRALDAQKPYDGYRSTINIVDSGLIDSNQYSVEDLQILRTDSVQDYFLRTRDRAATAYHNAVTKNDVYLDTSTYTSTTLIHEALHSAMQKSDQEIAYMLTGYWYKSKDGASAAISQVLAANGCGFEAR
jgi:hypothetical protein